MRGRGVWATTGTRPQAANRDCPDTDMSSRPVTNDVAGGLQRSRAAGMSSPPDAEHDGHGVERILADTRRCPIRVALGRLRAGDRHRIAPKTIRRGLWGGFGPRDYGTSGGARVLGNAQRDRCAAEGPRDVAFAALAMSFGSAVANCPQPRSDLRLTAPSATSNPLDGPTVAERWIQQGTIDR